MTDLAEVLPAPELAQPLDRLEAYVFRVPLKKPRINSFGKMTHRPALVVRLIDAEGAEGWGECFSNWPAFGAEHRYRILTEILAPMLAGARFAGPSEVSAHLARETRVLRIQTDERGPFDQAVAAVDIAAWDLAARRAGLPLYRVLGGPDGVDGVPFYASGLSPDQAVDIARRDLAGGVRAFKCKVGFGRETDLRTLTALREVLGPDTALMVDANQKWDVPAAIEAIGAFEPFGLDWVEEPIPADHPGHDFARLAEIGVPIAAGENIRGEAAFREMMTTGRLSVVQPDIIKWGGISGCLAVARRARGAGLRYCPHYLGGGIGLMATAHLLAAVGGDGLLELDATPNLLRRLLAEPFPEIADGLFPLSDRPGIGVSPDLAQLSAYQQRL